MIRFFYFSFLVLFSLEMSAFSVLSYNVENLFDVDHDEGKNDFFYLPQSHVLKKKGCHELNQGYYLKNCLESNWSLAYLNSKLDQVTKVIKSVGDVDVIGLVEVENEAVVKAIADRLGYDYRVSSSPDKRGIDVALLVKKDMTYSIKSVHEVVIQDLIHLGVYSRNILRVELLFKDSGKSLFFYVNHWPSQRSTTQMRLLASKALSEDVTNLTRKNGQVDVVIMGDFNTLESEKPNPVKYLEENLNLVDLSGKMRGKGTYYYKKDRLWNMLDRFLLTPALAKKLLSVSIQSNLGKEFVHHINNEVVPLSFEFDSSTKKVRGASDHFPILLTFDHFDI